MHFHKEVEVTKEQKHKAQRGSETLKLSGSLASSTTHTSFLAVKLPCQIRKKKTNLDKIIVNAGNVNYSIK